MTGRRAGFQGALGAFSEEAALALAPDAEPIPHDSFAQVVRAIESGEDDVGVIPLENSLAGTVVEAYDALAEGEVHIVSETAIPIRHRLLGLPGASIDALEEVRSHPVALAQCRGFFAKHPGIRSQAVYDTAGAAEEVARRGDRTVAAIASHRAAQRYRLETLARDLQDRDDNQTRFGLVTAGRWGPSGSPNGPSPLFAGPLKTSLIVELENRPGSLHGLLDVFARRELSLTHITSRPAPTPWTYRFIIEFRHESPHEAVTALVDARDESTKLVVLGSFPWCEAGRAPGADRGG